MIQYRADPGEANRITVSKQPTLPGDLQYLAGFNRTVIYDAGATIRRDSTFGQGLCTISGHRASCLTRDTPQVVLTLADRDDRVTATTYGYALSVLGGDGDDVLTGGPNGYAAMAGEAGNDTVYSRGSAGLAGGPGDDVLFAPAGTRGLMGGSPGADATFGEGDFQWDYSSYTTGVTVTPDGIANDGAPGEGDNVSPHTSDLYGGEGDDDLTAGDRGTFLLAGGGNDVIHGGPLHDGLFGYAGDDTIDARGGGSDVVGCSDGSDQAFVDALSELSFNSGCESVTVGP